MRSNLRVDQAEGLRRLLVRNHTKVVIVASGKSGEARIEITLNLAAALARLGKEVLVLDEMHSANGSVGNHGFTAKCDLLDVVQGKCKPSEAVLINQGFPVLSIARAMHSLAQLSQVEQLNLENALADVSYGMEVILVNAAMPVLNQVKGLSGHTDVSLCAANGVSLMVMVDATTSGITDSYALIKRLALENARLQFEIVVNKAVDEQAAMMVFGNMEKLARRNLAARLEYLGFIPQDDKLARATRLGKPVVEAFPASAAAKAYMELMKKLLSLPIQQSEMDGGVRAILQNLMKQISQPLQQHGKKMAQVVN